MASLASTSTTAEIRRPARLTPWALTIVEQLPTYWEISPSGTGLRGFGYGRKPGSRCRAGDFEMYVSGRYLCITGHHLEGTPASIEAVQDGIDAIYAQMFPTQQPADLQQRR